MFTVTHFIWLGIAVTLILTYLFVVKKCRLSFNFVLTTLLVISIMSELIKIFNNMELGYKDGRFLDVGSLPFHLCTIQIFFTFALKFIIKDEKKKDTLLAFMVPTMLLGGVMALLIPTVGVAFSKLQVYQYFIFHTSIVFFAIYVIANKLCKLDFKAYFRNLGFFGILIVVELWINSILSFENTNFLYVSRPPMDNLPILNLNNGWYVYFIHLLTIGLIILTIFHLPFAIISAKKKEANN